jgi:hypothetical protein
MVGILNFTNSYNSCVFIQNQNQLFMKKSNLVFLLANLIFISTSLISASFSQNFLK